MANADDVSLEAAKAKAEFGATPTQSFLAQLGLGASEGVTRALVGTPGIPADLLNMVRGISKAFGWAEEGGAFDKMMDYEPAPGLGKLFRGSDYFIERAGAGLDAVGAEKVPVLGTFDDPVPRSEPARGYARTAAEFATPVGVATKPVVAAGRMVSNAIRKRPVQDLLDEGASFAPYASNTPPPVRPAGAPDPGLAAPPRPAPAPDESIMRRLGRSADATGAGIGAAAGLATEYVDRNIESFPGAAAGLGTAIGLSALARGVPRQNAQQFVADRLPEDPETLAKAQAIMQAARENGIELSAAEALAQVGSRAMQRTLSNVMAYSDSPKPEAMAMRRQQQGQVKAAVQKHLDRLSGPEGIADEAVPADAADLAAQAYGGARNKLLIQPTSQLFDAAGNVDVDPGWVSGLTNTATRQQREVAKGGSVDKAYASFINNLTRRVVDPETGKEKNVLQLNVKQLHENYAELREELQRQADQGKKSAQIRLAGLQNAMVDGLEDASPEFSEAMNIYRRYADPFERSKRQAAGVAADWAERQKSSQAQADVGITPEGFANLLLPRNGKVSPDQIARFFRVLKRGDAEIIDQVRASLGEGGIPTTVPADRAAASSVIIRKLVSQMLGARLQEAFNTDSAQAGARSYSRKDYFPADKQTAVKQLLIEAADASGVERAGLVNGFHKLMEVLSATSEFPAVGAQTAGRAAEGVEAGTVSAGGQSGRAISSVLSIGSSDFLPKLVSDRLVEGGRRMTYRALGEILTRSDGLEILTELASKKARNPRTAKMLARSLLSLQASASDDARRSEDQ